jgi:hypothetical protein
VHTLAKYLIELSILKYSFCRFLPSLVAASAIYLAQRVVEPELTELFWHASLIHYSGYRECDLLDCARLLNALMGEARARIKPWAATLKYRSRAYYAVATLQPLPQEDLQTC